LSPSRNRPKSCMALEEPIRPLRTAYYLGYWLVEMRSRAEARWYASDVWPGLLVHLMAEIESAINELGHVLPVGQEAAMEHLLSVRESFTAAKQYLDGAWNDEHRIAIARENDDAEPEFIRTLSLAESPFCAPAWTNLESKLVELCEVLPPPILVCFRAGLAVSWLHGPPLTVSTQEGADELAAQRRFTSANVACLQSWIRCLHFPALIWTSCVTGSTGRCLRNASIPVGSNTRSGYG